MQDPNPSNITGTKVQQHNIEWQVNVGHVLLGLAVIYVAAKFGPPLLDATSGTDDDQMQPVGVEEVDSGLVG